MHPNSTFRWDDRAAMRELVSALGFGALFAATPDGPRVAHVPVVWLDDDTLALHVARGNGIARHLDGLTGLFSVQGPDGYVSPDWYGLGPDQVPTWNYLAVELEGTLRKMDEAGLIDQLDRLAAAQEALLPKTPWTRDKMKTTLFDQLLRGVTGFRLDITAWRGTRKLGQHKPEAARRAAADGVEASGRRALALLMREGLA